MKVDLVIYDHCAETVHYFLVEADNPTVQKLNGCYVNHDEYDDDVEEMLTALGNAFHEGLPPIVKAHVRSVEDFNVPQEIPLGMQLSKIIYCGFGA